LKVSSNRYQSATRDVAPIALLFLGVFALNGQTLIPTPGFVQDLSGQFPLISEFSFEQQIQIGTQANATTNNPFAYGHALQVRPWLHYDGIPNTPISGSAIYIYYFAVPTTNYYRHHEWRDTLMATVKQTLRGGSLYEQIRGESLNFDDSHGTDQHVPRIRIRFGQNLYLAEGARTLSKTVPRFVPRGGDAVPATVVLPRHFDNRKVLRRGWVRFGFKNSSFAGIQS